MKTETVRRRLYQFQTALAMWEKRGTLPPPEREATAYYVRKARKRLRKALKRWH